MTSIFGSSLNKAVDVVKKKTQFTMMLKLFFKCGNLRLESNRWYSL